MSKSSKPEGKIIDKSQGPNEIVMSSANGQEVDQVSGFERGLEAEKILGATEVDNEIHFLVKWYLPVQ